MKNMWKKLSGALVVLSVAGATIMTSCDKQKSMNELNSTVQKAEEQTAKQAVASGKTAARGEEVTAEEDFEQVFTELANSLDEENTLQITIVEGGYIFTLLTQHGTPAGRAAVCHSATFNSAFVNCTVNYAQSHGGCVHITHGPKAGWNAYGCG